MPTFCSYTCEGPCDECRPKSNKPPPIINYTDDGTRPVYEDRDGWGQQSTYTDD